MYIKILRRVTRLKSRLIGILTLDKIFSRMKLVFLAVLCKAKNSLVYKQKHVVRTNSRDVALVFLKEAQG
jgi:hypothetical protein